MLHPHPRKRTHSPLRLLGILALAVAGALTGCSALDLGPQPDNNVGSGGDPQSLTDPALNAVTPTAHGDKDNWPLPPSATAPATMPDSLSVQEAILVGLQNNVNLRVQRTNVPLRRTDEQSARAAFDPTVSGSLQGGRAGVGAPGSTTIDSINANASVTEFLPTGTTIQGSVGTANSFYSESNEGINASLTVTQSLLRGIGLDVNLATLRQAEISTKVSQYQLRGVAESLVATIEETYWNLAYAERQVGIVENALKLAQDQLDSTNASITVGRVAETERAAAEAQVELEKELLINAKSTLDTTRLQLRQLLTPASRNFWDRSIELTTFPFVPTGAMDPVDAHADVALRMSPAVNEAKLELQSGQLQVVRTKNGLLPRLDLFVTLGKSSLASSFGTSITNLNGPDYQAIFGVQGDWEPLNRAAQASYSAAQLTKDQLQDTLDNQQQLVQLDVRTQYIEVQRTRQQIDATKATRESEETSFKVEQAKFQQGRSTSLLVAQVQQLLLSARLAEVQAVTNHLNALVELYRIEGSLLERRGLHAPGDSPITLQR
jgi:outer membrane protein TolC